MNETTSTAERVLLAAVLLAATFSPGCTKTTSGPSTSIQPPDRILLFCDLSESTEFASADVEATVRKILLRAPQGSEVKVLAIHAHTDNASPIFVQRFDPERSGPKEQNARTDAAIKFSDNLKTYRAAIGGSNKQSCILDSLPRARQVVLESGQGVHRLAIGYLSDMIEDCPPPVRLPKGTKDLAHSLLVERLGNHYEEHIKLGSPKIIVCQPGSAAGASSEHSEFGRMKLVDRRDLWQQIAAKAGIRREIVYPDGGDGCVEELLKAEPYDRE